MDQNGPFWSMLALREVHFGPPTLLDPHGLDFASRNRRMTNGQQLTCNIDLSCSFYFLFFSFVLKGKVLEENL